MFSSAHNPIGAYRKVGVESDVTTADPHKLVLLLFEGAMAAIVIARAAMLENDIPRKGESISKAIRIIESGLKASLDLEQGGELAERLDALYEYMLNQLFHANLKNEVAALDEVAGLLTEIQSAWAQIRTEVVSPESQHAPQAEDGQGN